MQNLTFSSLSFSVSLAHCRHCQMGKAVGRGDVHVGDKNAPESFLSNFRGHIRIRGGLLCSFLSERKTDGEM